jgi:protein-S-isoprenylcysteine O-methyltransferase Ste14
MQQDRPLVRKAMQGAAFTLLMIGLLLFLPAWSLAWWQGWVFLAVFGLCTAGTTLYLARHDPALLARRLRAGPWAERETSQKIIQSIAMAAFAALLVVSALDHRLGWSGAGPGVVVLGNLLVVLSFLAILRVYRENSHTSALIEVAAGQRVISTGPYALVRHPMYTGALVMFAGMPLALGSFWGLLILLPTAATLMWRLLAEEAFLARNLPGYAEYRGRVRYRLIPFIW